MSESFKPLLRKLATQPDAFTPDDLTASLSHLLHETPSTPSQIGALLALLGAHQIDRKPEMIAAAASFMRSKAAPVELGESEGGWSDIVGTGGDGKDTFNVSTSAGIVAAGAGVAVCKHGNRASSSASGSADLLVSLGIPLTALTPSLQSELASKRQSLPNNGSFNFLFAPLYHPALAMIAPIRRELGIPTLFNILGPLMSPAKPSHMIVGVHSPYLGPIFAEALRILQVKRAWVVCGKEGLDEISTEGETWVWDLQNGTITERTISPETFGLPSHPLSSVAGGNSITNAGLLTSLLDGKLERDTPIETFVVLNTAALLVVSGKAQDERQGVEMARKSISDGSAKAALADFREAALAVTSAEISLT